MARCTLYPPLLPPEVRLNPKLSGEMAVYQALSKRLDASWHVFYSVKWQAPVRSGGRPLDGETDFIVAHPQQGILLIEVKGGRIRYDASLGTWIARDRYDQDYPIDPFNQVMRCKYALRELLAEKTGFAKEQIHLAHAVVFPHSDRPTGAITPNAQPEIILGANDLGQIEQRINALLSYYRPRQAFVHGDRLLPALIESLGFRHSIELPTPTFTRPAVPLSHPDATSTLAQPRQAAHTASASSTHAFQSSARSAPQVSRPAVAPAFVPPALRVRRWQRTTIQGGRALLVLIACLLTGYVLGLLHGGGSPFPPVVPSAAPSAEIAEMGQAGPVTPQPTVSLGIPTPRPTSTRTPMPLQMERAKATATTQARIANASQLYGLAMVSPDEGWAVGANGTMVHYSNGRWQSIPPLTMQTLTSIAMSSPTEGWAVGANATMLHYRAGTWEVIKSPVPTVAFTQVVMRSPTEGWAIGTSCTILRYRGEAWEPVKCPLSSFDYLTAIALVSSDDAWAVSSTGAFMHYDGIDWEQVKNTTASNWTSMAMVSTTDGWVVSSNGQFAHYANRKWEFVKPGLSQAVPLTSIAMLSPTEGWAVGQGGTILACKDGIWAPVKSPTSKVIQKLVMVSPTEGWGVGELGGIFHYTQGAWSKIDW